MAAAVRARVRWREEGAGAVSAGAADETLGRSWCGITSASTSIGRVKAFYGNFGVLVRALAYILAHGGPGLRNATMDAVLNAVYIRKQLEPYFDLPYQSPNMHEVVFSDDRQAKLGVRTGDIAKRLIDYGFHPYTVSFPLIVHGALMIEPTETESKQRDRPVRRRHDFDSQGSGGRSADGEERALWNPHQPGG